MGFSRAYQARDQSQARQGVDSMLNFNQKLAENVMKDQGKNFRKKPIVIQAFQMDQDFTVITLEGKMGGKAGDFLIRGIKGEFYPCAKDVFKLTYEELT